MKLFWQQIASTTITEILCSTKFDGVVLDLEHGCFDNSDIYQSIQIATLAKKKVFVRITSIDKSLVRMVLDAGVDGIILSTVESCDEYSELWKLCNYPNNDGRRGQGLVRENLWGKKDFEFRKPMIIPQIETIEGVRNAKKLLVYHKGPVLVGPYDLSADIGHVGHFKHPLFVKAIRELKEIFGDNLGYHIVKDIDKQFEGLKDSKFLAFGMDTLFLLEGVRRIEGVVDDYLV